MTQVGAARLAGDFCACYTQFRVYFAIQVFLPRIEKRRPTRSAVVLAFGFKERGFTDNAPIYTVFVVVVKCACESPFGAFIGDNRILLWSQSFFKFLCVVLRFQRHGSTLSQGFNPPKP